MTIVTDSIAAQIAELEREVDAPTGALGYGRDLSCVLDVTPDFAEVDPASPVAIAEAVARRFITPRGALADDPSYGTDVRSYCNRGTTLAELRDLSGQLRTEAKKDDRVSDAQITATSETTATGLAGSLSIACRITPADPAVAVFSFTLSVTSTDVLISTISQ